VNRDFARYWKAHSLSVVALGFVVVLTLDVLFGKAHLALPNAHSSWPLRQLLPIGCSCLVAASLYSRLGQQEKCATQGFRHAQTAHLLLLSALSGALLAVAERFPAEASLIVVRSEWLWLGLALVSGRVFGWQLSFIGPIATLFPLTYWELDAAGNVRWWDWVDQPAAAPQPWLLMAGALCAGIGCYVVTPWRLASLRHRVRRRIDWT
jgi:hypothetical protein